MAGDPGYFVTRQAIAAALGGVGLVVAIATPPSLYRRHWRVVYAVAIGLMVFVFGFAEAVRGSKRWIDIGALQFQPSEFGKVLFVLAIAGFLVERQRDMGRLRTVGAALALGAAPMLLVFVQPDLGTALVYAATFSAVLFVAGVRWLHLALLDDTGRDARPRGALVPPVGGGRGAQAIPDPRASRGSRTRPPIRAG